MTAIMIYLSIGALVWLAVLRSGFLIAHVNDRKRRGEPCTMTGLVTATVLFIIIWPFIVVTSFIEVVRQR